METSFNQMQQIKRRFFAMRNGVVADMLRRAGSPFHIIFGLNLPQIVEIASEIPEMQREAMADALWQNRSTRESMLIAPMLMSPKDTDYACAIQMMHESPCAEVADILCHRLLRHTPFALRLARECAEDKDEKVRYAALRLMFNLVADNAQESMDMARSELDRNCAYTRKIAAALLDEADFMLNP